MRLQGQIRRGDEGGALETEGGEVNGVIGVEGSKRSRRGSRKERLRRGGRGSRRERLRMGTVLNHIHAPSRFLLP